MINKILNYLNRAKIFIKSNFKDINTLPLTSLIKIRVLIILIRLLNISYLISLIRDKLLILSLIFLLNTSPFIQLS